MNQYTPPTPAELQAQRARQKFQVSLAWAYSDARLQNTPTCPLFPTDTITLDGTTYALEWIETGGFDSMGPTAKYAVTVTSHDTGRHVLFPQVIRKVRRSKATGRATVRYNSAAGNHTERHEVAKALTALAAAQLTKTAVAA